MATHAQPEGGVSAFASLSSMVSEPSTSRSTTSKRDSIAGKEDLIKDSFYRLLDSLKEETAAVKALGSKSIPEIDFRDLKDASSGFSNEYKKRGAAVIRSVVREVEALEMKEQLREYIKANSHTAALPGDMYELYWSPAQIRARSHPYLLATQKFLISHWTAKDQNALISTAHPTIYADRLRVRAAGDDLLTIGSHVGGPATWELPNYGDVDVYGAVWEGRWEELDNWEASSRLSATPDVGTCSMFRMAQGWLSMSNIKASEGSLLVNPLLKHAMAYRLLRPFFSAKKGPMDPTSDTFDEAFLAKDNWVLNSPQTASFSGKNQELNHVIYPHLDLKNTMVQIPDVTPGDYVTWHCDTHAIQPESSALYIPAPACPLTAQNAEFLAGQRHAFLEGYPGPDFGDGVGESKHVNRPGIEDVLKASMEKDIGMVAFGLQEFDSSADGFGEAQRELFDRANKVLGFYD